MQEQLILVNDYDHPTGTMDKMTVHQKGMLHRAFSVFIFNSRNELLLQKRAENKYHSPLLWSNTCCSHPVAGENMSDTIQRRLQEEMGLSCKTEFAFRFKYCISFSNGLIEHEWDHVYIGHSDHLPVPDPKEVTDWKYISIPELDEQISVNPSQFSGWLNICLPNVIREYRKRIDN